MARTPPKEPNIITFDGHTVWVEEEYHFLDSHRKNVISITVQPRTAMAPQPLIARIIKAMPANWEVTDVSLERDDDQTSNDVFHSNSVRVEGASLDAVTSRMRRAAEVYAQSHAINTAVRQALIGRDVSEETVTHALNAICDDLLRGVNLPNFIKAELAVLASCGIPPQTMGQLQADIGKITGIDFSRQGRGGGTPR